MLSLQQNLRVFMDVTWVFVGFSFVFSWLSPVSLHALPFVTPSTHSKPPAGPSRRAERLALDASVWVVFACPGKILKKAV